jgi:hypothetical protein
VTAITRKDSTTMRTTLSTLLLLVTTATPVAAATLQVANNGLDAAGCGTKAVPCRSITRALAAAASGDTIVVGPGRYGDLDRDGTLGEAGEEAPAVGALIVVDKAVSIVSSTGAVWTIVDVAGLDRAAVRITASGARFGKAKKGFTLFDGTSNGVSIEAAAANVVVEGNLAVRMGNGFATSGTGGGHVIVGNVASAGGAGVLLGSAGGGTARSNLAVANTGSGYDGGGTGLQRFEGDVATANGAFGFLATLSTDVAIAGGAAVGNAQGVFGGNGDRLIVSGLAALANVEAGVHNQGTTTMSVTTSNLVGNGARALGGALNCGAANEALPLAAINVFWGAATGPGDDPADDVCDLLAGVTTTDPVATKPFKIKTKAPQP